MVNNSLTNFMFLMQVFFFNMHLVLILIKTVYIFKVMWLLERQEGP